MGYYIDFGNSVSNVRFDCVMDAKYYADESLTFTGRDVAIKRATDGKTVSVRLWVGDADAETEPSKECIYFGKYGFYTRWLFVRC